MKKLLTVVVTTVFAAVAAYADTFVWTGKGELDSNYRQAFTNAANWKMLATGLPATRAPGMIWDCVQSQESFEAAWATFDAHADDCVIFDHVVEGTIIDLSGHVCVSNILFTGDIAVATFAAYVSTSPLGICRGGTLTVAADTANLPNLTTGVSVGTGGSKTDRASGTLVNEKAGSQLQIPFYGRPSVRDSVDDTHYGSCYFQGAGGFRFGVLSTDMVVPDYYGGVKKTSVVVHRSFYWQQAGKLTFYKPNTTGVWSWIDWDVFDGASDQNEAELLTGATLYTSGNGGAHRSYANTVLTGDGTFYMTGDTYYTDKKTGNLVWYPQHGFAPLAKSGKTLAVRCRLGYYTPTDHLRAMRFQTNSSDYNSGIPMTGTVDLTEVVENDPADGIFVHFPMTLKVAGIDGDSSVVSNAFGATGKIALSGGGILAYAGPGETTTREIAITNLHKNAYTRNEEATLAATLSQRGTGKWIVSGVRNSAGGTQTAKLTLDNDTAVDAELASAIGNNPAGSRGTDILKTGAGKWILSANNGTVGTLTISKGEIEVDVTGKTGSMKYDLAGGTTLRFTGEGIWRALKQITARGGQSTVVLGDKSVAQLDALPVSADGGSVNFVLEGAATLSYAAGKGSFLPSYITVNGKPALVNGAGLVRPDDEPIVPTSAIPAKGGVITNGETIVGITTEGTTGPITLSAAQTAVDMLVQKTETPATVSIGAGETLTAKTIIVEKDAGALTIGAEAGGSLAAADGVALTLKNDSTSALTVTAPLMLPSGASVNKKGAGAVTLPGTGTWSSDFFLTSGSLAIGELDFTTPGANEAFNYAATDDTHATLSSREGSTVHVTGETAEGSLLALNVPGGEMTVSGGERIETMSVTVGGTGDAKLVLKDGADVYFPEQCGVFRLGATSGTASSGVAEMVVENATVSTLLFPQKDPRLDTDKKDYKRFIDRQDRAVIVGGAKGDGLLRVKSGAIITNRLSLGANDHKSACYMDGGTFVSLGGDCNKGGDRYTLFSCGNEKNQSYFEQKAGTFINYESAQMGKDGASSVFMMTGGRFRICVHPLSPSGDNNSYFTLQPSSGNATMYVGGNAYWDGCYSFFMPDQGTGTGTITVDGNATMRHMNTIRFADNRKRDMDHPHVFNVNGNGQMHFWATTLNGSYLEAYDAAGNRIKAPAYLNLNGGTVVQPYNGSREFIGFKDDVKYQAFNRITVYENGGAYQISNGYMVARGVITNATGKGVWSVPLDEPITGSIVPPTVRIEGDGVAATAMALYDSATQTTTNILVTSHGCDYTWAKAKLYYGTTLLKEIDCELKDNTTGKLTFRGAAGKGYLMFFTRVSPGIPEVVFDVADSTYVNEDYAISSNTVVTVNSGTLGFDNSDKIYRTVIPACLRSDTDVASLRAGRPEGGFTTAGFPVRGSNGLNWNWQTNYVVGCTTIDCGTLVTNRLNGIVPTIADRYVGGLMFADTATIAFTNLDALEDQEGSFTIMRYAPTDSPLVTGFIGMPMLTTALPEGWRVKKVGCELRLKKIKGLAVIVR